jgi:hypothetical protein
MAQILQETPLRSSHFLAALKANITSKTIKFSTYSGQDPLEILTRVPPNTAPKASQHEAERQGQRYAYTPHLKQKQFQTSPRASFWLFFVVGGTHRFSLST